MSESTPVERNKHNLYWRIFLKFTPPLFYIQRMDDGQKEVSIMDFSKQQQVELENNISSKDIEINEYAEKINNYLNNNTP